MTKIDIRENQTFSIDDANFVIDLSTGQNRRPSDDTAFTIVKNEPYIRQYESIAASIKPKTILELGVFQGGGYVFLDKLFRPDRMSAVEISKQPIAPLMSYVARNPARSVHFGTSQSDAAALRQVVANDLGGTLDLVVDDASHAYDHTKKSFEILFPLLSPNGTYIIEDWSWSHGPRYQGPDASSANQPALTNLLFEQIVLMGSTATIAEITIRKFLYVIKKTGFKMPPDKQIWEDNLLRGRKLTPI